MPKFLTTADISAEVERVIKRAQHRVVLVSPYIRAHKRIRSLVKEQAERGVEIHIVYGKDELHDKERDWIDSLPAVRLHFHTDLHAKCYMNESSAVVTSMNLYEFSQINNIEMGVLLEAQGDAEVFEDVVEEMERIIHTAEERSPSTPPSSGKNAGTGTAPVETATTEFNSTATNAEREQGYCIRCGTRICKTTNRPYCKSCYKAWADTGKGRPPERYCHHCGEESRVHFKRPICRPCWRKSKARSQ